MKIILPAVIIFLLLCFISCKDNDVAFPANQNKATAPVKKAISSRITINSFSDFPSEIDGCSCYFSIDSVDFKRSNFIYVNNFAATSFMKINGKLIKFIETAHRQAKGTDVIAKYSSPEYKMMILVKDGKQNGNETSLKSGLIKISNNNGETVTQTFYGECGC